MSHKYELKRKTHSNTYLLNTYIKYGKKNLEFSIIEECKIDILLEREKHWIEYYETLNPHKGFNIMNIHKTKNHYIQSYPKDKLDDELVKLIKTDLYNEQKPIDIANKYNIKLTVIYNIRNLKTYKNILKKYNNKIIKGKPKTFDDMDYNEKYEYLRKGLLKGKIKIHSNSKYSKTKYVNIIECNVDKYIFTCCKCGNPDVYTTSARNNKKCKNCSHYIKKPYRKIICEVCKREFEVPSMVRNKTKCDECLLK